MNRRFWIIATIVLVLFSVAIPASTVQARVFSFGQAPAAWRVTVKVCQNGFTVTATGGTAPGTITAVRAVDATLLLPNLKPPFIRLSRPLPFTSIRGSTIVAIAANPNIQVIGTASFYFSETLAIGALIETTLDAYVNEAPQNVPGGIGTDVVKNCTLPQPLPLISDLSGVNPIDLAARGGSFGNDGRASPSGADKMAVYCLTTGPYAGNIVVNGLDANAHGYALEDFKVSEVTAARPKAISKAAAGNQGEVSMYVNSQGIFGVEWTHGPWSPHEFKGFTCAMDKSMYNKTGSQLQYANAFGNDGRVAPNAGEKMAVYCRVGASVIDIVGIDTNSNGYGLASFTYAELQAASPKPVVKNVQGQGSVSLQVDGDDNFYLIWHGGPYISDQTKGFKCRF